MVRDLTVTPANLQEPERLSFDITRDELRRLPDEIREFILVNMYGDYFGRWIAAALGLCSEDVLSVSLTRDKFDELVDRIQAINEQAWAFLGRS